MKNIRVRISPDGRVTAQRIPVLLIGEIKHDIRPLQMASPPFADIITARAQFGKLRRMRDIDTASLNGI